MATARFVVNLALRKLGKLAGGREARVQDATDTLDALRGLYGSWIASGAFGRLEDRVPLGSVYVTPGNERIIREADATVEVVLPSLVSLGCERDYGHGCYGTTVIINGSGFTLSPALRRYDVASPRDGSAVVISDMVGGETRTWLYDGTLKQWQSTDTLSLDDEAPRSAADVQGLAACLAIEISDQFGAQVQPATLQQAARFTGQMTQRFGMRRQEVAGVYF